MARVSVPQKETLVKLYQSKNPEIKVKVSHADNIAFVYDYEWKNPSPHSLGYMPDMVTDISGTVHFVLDPDTYLPENGVHVRAHVLPRYALQISRRHMDERDRPSRAGG